jgi:hypothetical protein
VKTPQKSFKKCVGQNGGVDFFWAGNTLKTPDYKTMFDRGK